MFKVIASLDKGGEVMVLGVTPEDLARLQAGTGIHFDGPGARVAVTIVALVPVTDHDAFEAVMERLLPGGRFVPLAVEALH